MGLEPDADLLSRHAGPSSVSLVSTDERTHVGTGNSAITSSGTGLRIDAVHLSLYVSPVSAATGLASGPRGRACRVRGAAAPRGTRRPRNGHEYGRPDR